MNNDELVRDVVKNLMAITAKMARGDGLGSDIGNDHPRQPRRDYWLLLQSKNLDTAKIWALDIRDQINRLATVISRGDENG